MSNSISGNRFAPDQKYERFKKLRSVGAGFLATLAPRITIVRGVDWDQECSRKVSYNPDDHVWRSEPGPVEADNGSHLKWGVKQIYVGERGQ